ncbi:Pfs NACHT and Ankyrin domain protein [Pyrenophora tritici-repentis]|nr:Pfs domain-containing protein [Pyrenophora tritici-repentis]KAF7451369.1 hypothetical protein A1F99_031460 [Pyrenophora tritici-repentis]KAI1532953.1 Pfs NACHT and Ankyrin domain protein [Pyrenophora tritici-repentis]KAI1535837.1 Pfs NACHT and Ankyrin domain protein [Pyrenophora tritici-repentis]KAI1546194.1 Pfs NACHT and Ankyrin domain protein [Pyrenophora tritici-repentis]
MMAVALILEEVRGAHAESQEILLAAIATGLSSPNTGTPSCFTKEYFSRITNRFSSSVVETLLRHKRDDIKITERMMIDIARWCEPAVVDFALQEKEESMSLSEDIIVAAVENRDDDEVFHLMIASTWTKIEITDSVVKSAYDGGKSALKILLNQEKVIISITDEMLITSVRFLRPTVLALLLDHMEDKVEITEYVLVASLQRRFYRLDVIKLLLDRSGSNFEITSAILIAAVQHGEDALEITTLLLDYAGGRVEISQSILAASLRNEKYGLMSLKLLLAQSGSKVGNSEPVLCEATRLRE